MENVLCEEGAATAPEQLIVDGEGMHKEQMLFT